MGAKKPMIDVNWKPEDKSSSKTFIRVELLDESIDSEIRLMLALNNVIGHFQATGLVDDEQIRRASYWLYSKHNN